MPAWFSGVGIVGAVGTGNPKFWANYLQGNIVAVIVPVHARLLGEAHRRMLVGLFARFVVKVVRPQGVAERQSGAPLARLGAGDGF